jgi:hypothetical protein
MADATSVMTTSGPETFSEYRPHACSENSFVEALRSAKSRFHGPYCVWPSEANRALTAFLGRF